MTGPFDTIAEAEECAVRESEGGLYATLCACFGVFVTTSKTLHIHAPALSLIHISEPHET